MNKKKETKLVVTILREFIKQQGYKSSFRNEAVIIDELQMEIKFNLGQKKQYEDVNVIQINFLISSMLFDDEIKESLAGVGPKNNIYEAIKSAVESFDLGIFSMILECFKEKRSTDIDLNTIFGLNKLSWLVKLSSVQRQGQHIQSDVNESVFFNLIKPAILSNVGNKHFYVIKIFASKDVNAKPIVECTINNEPFLDAENIIIKDTSNWQISSFSSQKQYIIISQSDDTFMPVNPLTQLAPLIEQVITIIEEDDHDDAYDKLSKLSNDQDMILELYTFIPLIYCMMLIDDIKYGDNIIIKMADNTQIKMKLSQFHYFNLIKRVVYHHLEREYDDNKIANVLLHNTMFNAINNALNQGKKLEDLFCDDFSFDAHKDYNPYR